MNKCRRCGKLTKNPFFCSRRCAGLYNIEGGFKSKNWIRKCEICGKEFISKGILRKRCFDCSPKYSRRKDPKGYRTCGACRKLKRISEFSKKNRNYCRECASRYDVERQQLVKSYAVKLLGNKCVRCGYNKTLSALEFHHLKNKEKSWSIVRKWKLERIEKYLENCILVCSNCHREIHWKDIKEFKFRIKLR